MALLGLKHVARLGDNPNARLAVLARLLSEGVPMSASDAFEVFRMFQEQAQERRAPHSNEAFESYVRAVLIEANRLRRCAVPPPLDGIAEEPISPGFAEAWSSLDPETRDRLRRFVIQNRLSNISLLEKQLLDLSAYARLLVKSDAPGAALAELLWERRYTVEEIAAAEGRSTEDVRSKVQRLWSNLNALRSASTSASDVSHDIK
jgi:hypothetical protein